MNKRVAVTVLVVVSFLAGSALSWWIRGYRVERERGSVAVVRAAEVAGLCATALGVAEQGRNAALQKLLETRMTSAVNEAAEQFGSASPPGFPVPNLVEGVNRAHRYAVANGMPEVAGKCDQLLEFLLRSNARA